VRNTQQPRKLSSSLLSKTVKIKIYRTMILPVVLYGCESWSRILNEERRLKVFLNSMLRRVFGPKKDEARRSGENYIMQSSTIFKPHQFLHGCSNQED
jgi:hypothetical protein